MRDYQQTITYLYQQLPVYQRVGSAAIKKDLTNITALASSLGNPHLSYPTIHIAGTNGKGTTAHLISSILQASGLKVGLYTSPHYEDFRERIKINGIYISEEYVTNFVAEQQSLMESLHPSFFEVTVAMAFQYFKDEQVDIAVIETGLGGRLDSTNIINPLLSVITNISLDHQNMLGPDIYTIAGEKAGIIKTERPVVIGRYQPSCDHVFIKKGKEKKASLSFASLEWEGQRFDNVIRIGHNTAEEQYTFQLSDQGPFIIENIITTLQTIKIYSEEIGIRISPLSIKMGIEQYRTLSNYIGRWQKLDSKPDVITDSAHNEDAIKKVLSHIESCDYEDIHCILGFVGDKDVDKILQMLHPDYNYYFTQPSISRALPKRELQDKAENYNLTGVLCDDVTQAYQAACAAANSKDLIYIGGSSFIVADILTHLNSKRL